MIISDILDRLRELDQAGVLIRYDSPTKEDKIRVALVNIGEQRLGICPIRDGELRARRLNLSFTSTSADIRNKQTRLDGTCYFDLGSQSYAVFPSHSPLFRQLPYEILMRDVFSNMSDLPTCHS